MAGNSGRSEGGAYQSGAGRPPESGRFRKGFSGNPAGRPKGARNRPRPESDQLRALIRREAYRPVKVRIDGKEITMPLAQAAYRSLGTSALAGDTRALAIFIKMLRADAAEEDAVMAELLEAAREAEAPDKIEVRIVDVVDGRPVGEPRVYEPDEGGKAIDEKRR